MNWIVSLRRYVGIAFLLLLSFVLGGLVYGGIGSSDRIKESSSPANQVGTVLGNAEEITEVPVRKLKEIEYEELSPDRAQKAIEYKMIFNEQLYDDYYNGFFVNQKIIAVEDIKTGTEYYVFTGEERTGNPHWLGNNNLFFYTHRGTSCRGVYLVDARDKETQFGGFSFNFEGG